MSEHWSRPTALAMAASIMLVVAAPGASPVFAAAAQASTPISAPASSAIRAATSHTSREVFGFALASSLADPTIGYPSWNFDLLSTVAFFGLHVNTAGQFAADSGWTVWNSSSLTAMVTAAHKHGARVVLTIILQDFSPNTPNMCAGLNHAAATVAQTVHEVAAKHVDGVNIDYEGLDGSCGTSDSFWAQHAMNSFAAKMRAGLGTSPYLSVDTYAGAATDPYGFFDVARLSSIADSLFVMAYDMEYSNYARAPAGCTRFCLGPTAPLTGYYYNDTSITSQYLAMVPASKVILGVPYYGRKACVGAPIPDAYPNSSVIADGYQDAAGEAAFYQVKAGTYIAHRDGSSSGSERWDTWYNTTLSCTRELYWDDTVSLGKKYDLVNHSALRGVGIWTLNYGGGAPELWTTLAAHFSACSGVGVALSPAPPANVGTPVAITAGASGCPNPLYEFWMRPAASSTWQLVQGYSSNPTYRWNSSGAPPGAVYFGVWARDAGSPAAHDALAAATYNVISPCAAVAASLSPPSPLLRGSGATVTVTGTASRCPNPLYEFWMQPQGSTTWRLLQGYSTSPTYRWNTSGALAGTEHFGVWARDAASRAAYDTYASTTFTLSSPCSSVTAAFSPGSPQPRGSGATVSVAGSASGCPNPLYEFWMMPQGSTTWRLVQGYSTSPTYRWNTTGAPAGTEHFGVWVRDGASTAAYDTYAAAQFTLSSPCTSVSASLSPPSPQRHGSGVTVTITGSASGCASPFYEFWMLPAGSSTWRIVQGYSTSAIYRWNTNGAPAGAERFGVWARDASSTAPYDTYASVPYALT